MNAGIGRMSALGANRTRQDGGNDVNDPKRSCGAFFPMHRVFGAAALRARDDAFPLSLGRGLGHRPDHLLVRYSSPSKTLESLNTGWTFCPTFWNHMRNALANLSRDPNMNFEDIWCAPRNGAGPPPNRAFPGAASTRNKDRICKRPITPRPSPRRPAGV